ncbi:pyridoxal-dependent decarboxylase [Escherichia coli]
MPTFGVTYTGNYEFPQPLHDALDKFQADTGIDIDMHIDAASGESSCTVRRPGYRLGLPPAACEIDQLQAINSVWLRWAAAGLSGVTKKRCRRNWCSTLTTWVVKLVLSSSTSPARRVR